MAIDTRTAPVTTKTPERVKLRPKALLTRGTGSKRRHIPLWADLLASKPFDTVVEPFGQGLWVTQALNQAADSTLTRVIAAESLVDMRSIWEAWRNPDWQWEINAILTQWQRKPVETAWPSIKQTWEQAQASGKCTPLAAAAGLSVRALSFSGICRDSPGNGRLNITWNKSQLKRWHPILEEMLCGYSTGRVVKANHPHHQEWLSSDVKWLSSKVDVIPGFLEYRFHDRGYRPDWPKEPPRDFQIYDDFSKVVYPEDNRLTVAVIDPPYVGDVSNPPPARRSGRFITPAYYGHRPHAKFTYDMAVTSVRAALEAGCGLVIACNYGSGLLDADYRALAAVHGYSCDREVYGELKGLNNNAKPAKVSAGYVDTYWVLKNLAC